MPCPRHSCVLVSVATRLGRLAIAFGVLGIAPAAHAVIDMTGFWDVIVTGGPMASIHFVQSGTDLRTPELGGTGTIDPDTGVFHVSSFAPAYRSRATTGLASERAEGV